MASNTQNGDARAAHLKLDDLAAQRERAAQSALNL
jgi:hypothetical protein